MPAIGSVWAPNTWDVDAWAADTWADAEAPVIVGGFTEMILIGPVATLTTGVIYAMPARRTLCRVQQSGGTIEVSNDGTTFAAVTLDDDEQFEAGGLFIKAVTTDAIVSFKV